MKKVFTYKKNKISKSSSIDELYKEYQNRMLGKAINLSSKGISKDVNFMSKDRFEEKYLKGIDENKKASASAIVDKMVTKQLSSVSRKQALNVVRESKLPGSKYKREYSLLEAMYGDDIWEEIKRVYKEQKDSGKTAEKAAHHIAMTFFGSD